MQTPYSPTPGRTPDYCDVPIPTQECCEHPSCQQPNPPFYCTRCNSLPIDGWVPFMVLLGLVIGLYSMRKYGKTG